MPVMTQHCNAAVVPAQVPRLPACLLHPSFKTEQMQRIGKGWGWLGKAVGQTLRPFVCPLRLLSLLRSGIGT